jgi:RHS repeat-associated protein
VYVDGTFEQVFTQSRGNEWKTYFGDFAVVTRTPSGSRTVEYLLKDRLGSVDSVANSQGFLVDTRAHDPFGKPRQGNWADIPGAPRFSAASIGITPRGFTQHEHLNSVEIIHMNGRAFDYSLGRFLSVDPLIQGAEHSQSLNPYAYLHNNPLAGTDPTGYCGESLGTRIKDQGACQFSLVGTLANGDTKDLGSYNLNKPGDEMRANDTSLASLFGSGAAGLGVVGPSLQSSGSTAIGAKEGLKPQTTPSAAVAVVGGAATAGKVMETVEVTATASRSARIAQAAAGLRWLIGGMAVAADDNNFKASIHGLPPNNCYGNCTCEWVSGNLCMFGGGRQDEMRVASHPQTGAAESSTPSGPPDGDGEWAALVSNPKHHPNSKSPEPRNVHELYSRSIRSSDGRRWARAEDGTIHRFSAPRNGETHWNGSTAGSQPIRRNSIPNEILKQLEGQQ